MNVAGGRPTTYKPEYAAQAEKLCSLGATNVDLADFFSCTISTIGKWRTANAEFSAALKIGKESADERVVKSLYHRAVGYTHDAVKIFMPAGAKEPVHAPYREHVPPDTTACIFWLKNRRPEQWRDRSEHVVRHQVMVMTDDELSRIAAGGGKRTIEAANGKEKPH